ncbi:MAG: hypothetical protein ACTHKD_00230, partial [Devosia sp.]
LAGGIRTAFLVGASIALLAVVTTFFLKKPDPPPQGGWGGGHEAAGNDCQKARSDPRFYV